MHTQIPGDRKGSCFLATFDFRRYKVGGGAGWGRPFRGNLIVKAPTGFQILSDTGSKWCIDFAVKLHRCNQHIRHGR